MKSGALAALAVLVLVIIVVVRRKRGSEGFASDGGPAGNLLVGGSVVAHHVESDILNARPCKRFKGLYVQGLKPEKFETKTWDVRANFTPNPHPEKESIGTLLGHDLMGVPRKFQV